MKFLGVGVVRLNDVFDGEGLWCVVVWEGVKGEVSDWDLEFDGMVDIFFDEDFGELLNMFDYIDVD